MLFRKKPKWEKEVDRWERQERLPLTISITALIIALITLGMKIAPYLSSR